MELMRRQWPLLTVLAVVAVSLLTVALDHFRRGSLLLAGSVFLAFFLRVFLSDRDAGWLVVRSRTVDLITVGSLALALTIFAVIVPPPR